MKKLIDFFAVRRNEIHRHDGQLYMIRWSFTPFIKVHKFVRSDDSCMHDHPWWFFSIVLRGSYWDVTPKDKGCTTAAIEFEKKKMRAGRIMFRKPLHLHRVELEEEWIERKGQHPDSKMLATKQACWTLVINGPDQREWGFMTTTGWIEWKKFFERDKSRNVCK